MMNNKKENKKGQFYLVAAIIIILAISGIASVKTYSVVKSEPKKLGDISSELKEESSRIVDYGIYNQKELSTILSNFTEEQFALYFIQKTDNVSIVFLYGNKTELYSVQYHNRYTGTVYATLGGVSSQWLPTTLYANRTKIDATGLNSVNVTILGKDFRFNLKENEMFYFLITQEKQGEIYIERNE